MPNFKKKNFIQRSSFQFCRFPTGKTGVEKRISSLTRKSSEIRNFGNSEKIGKNEIGMNIAVSYSILDQFSVKLAVKMPHMKLSERF